jgi:signal transduction histidine kinase
MKDSGLLSTREWLNRQAFVMLAGACILIIVIHPSFHFVLKLLPDIAEDSLLSRTIVAVLATVFLALTLVLKPLRKYSEFFSFIVVTSLLISVAQLIVDSKNHYIYVAAGLLAIFGSTLPYTRVSTTVASYTIAFAFQIVYNRWQRPMDIHDRVAIAICLNAFVISGVMSFLRIQSLRRLQLSQRRDYERELAQQRIRIARDVHDSVGSDLTNLILHTSGAKSGEILYAHQLAKRVFEKMKDVVSFLQGDDGNEENTGTFIAEYVERLNFTGKFQATLQTTGYTPLDDVRLNVHFRRIFCEWMSNTLRHSKPDKIDIILRSRDNMCYLLIRDNGHGFRWNGQSMYSGLGNISDRVQHMRGKTFSRKWESAGTGGTLFFLKAPGSRKPAQPTGAGTNG